MTTKLSIHSCATIFAAFSAGACFTGSALAAANTASIDNITAATNHATIQDAINNASAGDVIEIGAGIVCESGIMGDRSLTIRGQGMNATTIDAESNAGVLSWTGDLLTLEDLTLTNGANAAFGGGLNVNANVDTVDISGVRFLNNSGDAGGGLFCNGGQDPLRTTRIDGCEFIGNTATGAGGFAGLGGGILFAFQNDTALVTNTLFQENMGGVQASGIQVFAQFMTSLTLTNCTFVENPLSANGNNQLIFVQSGSGVDTDLQINNCVFDDNGSNVIRDNNTQGSIRNSVLGPATTITGIIDAGGNTTTAPTFENAAGDDFRLAAGSSGIDIGDFDLYTAVGGGIFDLAGADRTQNDAGTADSGSGVFTHLDAGAYEFGGCTSSACAADINGDGVIDTADLGILIGVFGSNCP